MASKIVILCLTVFFGRIIDVSLSTVRTLFNVKGQKEIAAGIGFIEAFVWFMVVKDAMKDNFGGMWVVLAYSLGFAAGTYIGIILGKILIKTNVQVQVITTSRDENMLKAIRNEGYAIIVLDVNSSEFGEEKYMILAEINGKKVGDFKKLINSLDEKAFITVQESKLVYNGYFMKK